MGTDQTAGHTRRAQNGCRQRLECHLSRHRHLPLAVAPPETFALITTTLQVMKALLIFFTIFGFGVSLAEETALPYATEPNTSGYPFPATFPVLPDGKELQFDWKRYIGEAVSDGDKVFRTHLARSSGFSSSTAKMWGVGESASDEMTRNQIAADEVSNGCVIIETMYRDRLKKNAEVLATLEEFISHHRKAIEASIKLVGGSWDGGSGARVAYPAARLGAFVRYRAALLDLRSSLHFQDFPEIAFPTPSKVTK